MSTPPEPPLSAAALAEHDALAPGTRLGELEVLRILGVGGFGIVYLARDHSLEREVALKEYMPASLAKRGEGAQITIRSASFVDTYAIGLRSFINEAKLLARFDHPSLVKVYRFWEGNGTAYMVMPYLQGHTLRDVRRAMSQPPTEGWIRGVIERVLGALEVMHREGVFHRDIAPDNILITPEGLPILLDFGAARRVISDRTQTLTAILKPNYAPIEQYADMAQMRQGPWTDLYALGAVVHFLLKGAPPIPATARLVQDDQSMLQLPEALGVSKRFLTVIDWALALRPQDRPQDVASLRAALEGRLDPPLVPRQGVTVPGPTALMPVAGPAGSDGPTLRLYPGPLPGSELPTQVEPTFAPTQRMTTAPPPLPHSAVDASGFAPTVAAPAAAKPNRTAPDTPPSKTLPEAQRPTATAPAGQPHAETPRRRSAMVLVGVAVALVGTAAVWALVGRSTPNVPSAAVPAASPPATPSVASGTPPEVVPARAPATTPAATPVMSPTTPPVLATPTPEITAPTPDTAAPAPATAAVRPASQDAATVPPPVRTAQPTAARPRRTSPADTSVPAETAAQAEAGAQAPTQVQPHPPQTAAPMTPAAAAMPSAQAAADDPDEDPNAPRASLVTTARQICGNRPMYAMAECMQRQCRRPRFATDLDCLRLGPVSNRRLGDPP